MLTESGFRLTAMGNGQGRNGLHPKPDYIDAATIDPLKGWEGRVLVTPETARQWLEKYNLNNRLPRLAHVRQLVNMMKSGEWRQDHPASIVFSRRRLIDGQHRLMAIAESGVTMVVRLVCGIDDEIRQCIDNGVPRSLYDRVEFAECRTDNKNIVATANALAMVAARSMFGKLTPAQVTMIFNQNRDGILFAVRWGRNGTKKGRRSVIRAAVMASLAEMHRRSPHHAEKFAFSLNQVDGQVQQARYLRDFLIGHVGGGGATYRCIEFRKSATAMQAYLQGKLISRLYESDWEGGLAVPKL